MSLAIDQQIDKLAIDLPRMIHEACKDEPARKKLFKVVMGAMAQVETPVETIWRMMLSLHAPAALNTLIRMGAVAELVNAGKPMSAEELGAKLNADASLIVRLMRPLSALGIFKEVDVQLYEATAISQTLMTPALLGGYQFAFECGTRCLSQLPSYLSQTGWKDVKSSPGPFEYSHNTSDGMFAYLNKHPTMLKNFNTFMAGHLATRKNWFESFPVDQILLDDGASPSDSDVLLVDIGGGQGHDIQAFHRAFPNVPGKLILQDLPPTIDNIPSQSLDPFIVRQKHDFFTPQPIKGARAYYFRSIFHDWPDAEVVQIMKNVATAMTSGYSKMLVFEWVLPEKKVPLYPALLDVNMMAMFSGRERTRREWEGLFDEAGLRMLRVWKVGKGEAEAEGEEAEGLIEAELK